MDIIDIRHHLHRHPELSGKEIATHNFIVEQLADCHPTKIHQHAGQLPESPSNGVVAVWGADPEAPTVVFRADIDALPINETTDLPYRSEVTGVGHKCGHDGHTAILLRLARMIAEHELPLATNVILVFQPEEETGLGSKKILRSGILHQYNIRAIYGIHNLPGYSRNQVVLSRDTFAAASSGFIVNLHGRQTHASTPEKGINPGLAVSELIQQFDLLNTDTHQRSDFTQSTLIFVRLGDEAFGTSAGDASVAFTLRAFTNEAMQQLLTAAEKVSQSVAERYNLEYTTELREPFNATENNSRIVDRLHRHCILQERPATTIDRPFRWSEDFADYLMQFPGAMMGIGAGHHHAELHHPDYDFPDEIIEPTAQLLFSLITH